MDTLILFFGVAAIIIGFLCQIGNVGSSDRTPTAPPPPAPTPSARSTQRPAARSAARAAPRQVPVSRPASRPVSAAHASTLPRVSASRTRANSIYNYPKCIVCRKRNLRGLPQVVFYDAARKRYRCSDGHTFTGKEW